MSEYPSASELRKILAGWCRKCYVVKAGFSGHYRPEMGAKLDQDEVGE